MIVVWDDTINWVVLYALIGVFFTAANLYWCATKYNYHLGKKIALCENIDWLDYLISIILVLPLWPMYIFFSLIEDVWPSHILFCKLLFSYCKCYSKYLVYFLPILCLGLLWLLE